MSGWVHDNAPADWLNPSCVTCMAEHYEDDPLAPDAICTAPTPDPASPCGYVGCVDPTSEWHGACFHLDDHDEQEDCHVRVPTRCLTCGHPIEERA